MRKISPHARAHCSEYSFCNLERKYYDWHPHQSHKKWEQVSKSQNYSLTREKNLQHCMSKIFESREFQFDQSMPVWYTSLLGQTKEMKEAKGGLLLSYTSVPSMIHEIIGRTTACPCSGWWRTNIAESWIKS